MLVKVISSTDVEDYTNKNFQCLINEWSSPPKQQHSCKLHLISTNLVDNNVGKILISELTEIKNANTESPKDSYIILELTANTDKSKTFVNKEILVKHNSDTSLVVKFDKVLYKKSTTLDSKTVDVLVPLKKNIHSFLIERQSIRELFQEEKEQTSFKCSYNKNQNGETFEAGINTDNSCKIIKIDLPKDAEKTLITLDAIKKSSSLFTKADLTSTTNTKYIKLDVDINKFYNTATYDFSDEEIEVSYGSKKIHLTISHSISEKEIQGKINWLIVRYREESGEITTNVTSNVCATRATIPKSFNQKSCTIHELEGNQPFDKADVEKVLINSTQVNDKKKLTKDRLYAIQYTDGPDQTILEDKKDFYLYTYKSGNGNQKIYDKHTFDVVALLSDKPTKANKSLLLSEIKNLPH